MTATKRILSLFIVLLFAGTALAQSDGGDDDPDGYQECEEEYREDRSEADQDHDEERQDADDEEERREADQDHQEDQDRAEREYQECLEDAREDQAERAGDGSAADRDDRHLPVPPSFAGRYVSFDVTRHGLTNYSVDGADILSSVRTPHAAAWDEYEREGASLELEGEHAELKVSDTPTGVLRFEADDQSIHVRFADGVDVRRADDHRGHGKHHLILEGATFTAHLFVDEGYHFDNDTLVADEEIRLAVVDAPGLRDQHQSNRTREALADGRIAVEVDVDRNRDLRAAEHGDVNVTIESTDTGLVATVESHGEGKTVLFNLDQGALGDIERLEVIFDGEPIGMADDVADVLDVSDGVAEYLILVGAEQTQVMVQVPHFSVHTIELSSASLSGAGVTVPSTALVAGAGIATVFVATTLAARRRD